MTLVTKVAVQFKAGASHDNGMTDSTRVAVGSGGGGIPAPTHPLDLLSASLIDM